MKSLFFTLLLCSFPAFAMLVKDGKVILEKLSDYPFCQSKDYDGSWCNAALEDWVESHPADAFQAAVMTRKAMNAWGAIPFFHKALADKDFDCKNEDVKLAVMSALDLPSSSYAEVVKQAKEIGIKKCGAELKESIAKAASIDGYMFANACADLDLAGLKKKKCDSLKK